MISEFTWPNHDLPSDKDAVRKLIECHGFQHDVAYGKTKLFIRTPRTLFTLEELHAKMLVRIVLFLQKVKLPPPQKLSSSSLNHPCSPFWLCCCTDSRLLQFGHCWIFSELFPWCSL